ncbi:cell differentiation protein Rcd1 [Ordospora colligata]|nr:cell differentiation protein Rcd1 [Ordospora colligata]
MMFTGVSTECSRQRLIEICENLVSNKTVYKRLEALFEELRKSPTMAFEVWSHDAMPIFLLQEVIAPYTIINTNKFSEENSSRLCMVLNILQILVGDTQIKHVFVDARFPYYIYRYLMISDIDSRHEVLRISSLGVIASLLKNGDQYVHKHLKITEIVPLLLKIVDIGPEESQLLSANVFTAIIGNDDGLSYACQTFDRFSAINMMFNSLASQSVGLKSTELLKTVLKVYIRLCAKPHIRTLLSSKRPDGLFSADIERFVSSDPEAKGLFRRFVDLLG